MIKPDGVQRGLVGTIISRWEIRGFQLLAMKQLIPSRVLAENHYAEHKGKPFFPRLVDFLISGPVVGMVWSGENVVAVTRQMIGKTKPSESAQGTVRGDFAVTMGKNIIHASDSLESAEREINLWFTKDEISSWKSTSENWIY